MQSIHFQNIRSLKDTGDINLTPITLLVGENSSGKSTFLRTFPLLKQSIRKRTDGPLLWAGDMDDYVDFGSFKETITNKDTQEEISFSFTFNFKRRRNSRPILGIIDFDETDLFGDMFPVDYSIFIKQLGQSDIQAYISKVKIKIFQSEFLFLFSRNFSEVAVVVDGQAVKLNQGGNAKRLPIMPYMYNSNYNSIFGFTLPDIRSILFNVYEQLLFPESANDNRLGLFHTFSREILNFLGAHLCHGEKLSSAIKANPNLQKSLKAEIRQINDKLNSLDAKSRDKYIAEIKLIYFYECFPAIDDYLNLYFRQIHYIAPLRATAERYYRLRNLSIDEVDYQGKNLSIFLDGLQRRNRISKFNEWTDKLFGFHVRTKNEAGHLSMQVFLQGKEDSVNLSDTGFGFSQILPIITQLWDLSTRQMRIPTLIAIEQPELHLHPSLQANLVNAFINSVTLPRTSTLQLLLETHSETIVNCFGQAIAEHKIPKDKVSVILFSKNKADGLTEIKRSTFDENGYLNDWPIGFFAPGR